MGGRNDNQADGRWTPVINNHTRHGGISRNQPLVTLFVDNLPDNTSQPWLKMMFNNYGVVKDVFIPQKRSKATGNKFGFIRYDCPVSADLAVLKANGLWLDDKKLFVKIASFGAKGGLKQAKIDKVDADTCQGGVNRSGSHNEVLVNNGRSFAQVLIGNKAPTGIDNLPKDAMKTINLQPVGNGWLFRSAIATLRRVISMVDLKQQLLLAKINFSDVRSLGGRFVLITFSNQQLRDDLIKGAWWDQWFDLIQPWNGEASGLERFAWISCRGIPLNVWGVSTFKKIGESWGTFLSVDDDTLKYLAFDKARILISTTSPHKIVDSIQLTVNQVQYLAHITEEEHPTFSLSNVGDNGSVVGGLDNWEAEKDDVEVFLSDGRPEGILKQNPPYKSSSTCHLKEYGEIIGSGKEYQHSHAPEVAHDLAVEIDGGNNEANSNSLHGLDSLVGLESLVVESFAHSSQGQDRGICMSSGGSDPIQNSTFSGKANWDQDFQSDYSDECQSLDLISADPLINYVELKRQKRKKRSKQGRRKKSFSLWRHNPLKATLFSRTYSLDKIEDKSRRSRRFKQGQQEKRRNDKSPSIVGSFSLGENRQSESRPSQTSLEAVISREKRMEEDYIATLTTGKNLGVSIRPEDEIVLKDMIEDEFKAFSQKIKQWEVIY